MSDDLVKRLRDDSGDWLTDLAADRIEELKAKLTKALEALCAVETATATADGMTPDETISLHAIISEKIKELKEKTDE